MWFFLWCTLVSFQKCPSSMGFEPFATVTFPNWWMFLVKNECTIRWKKYRQMQGFANWDRGREITWFLFLKYSLIWYTKYQFINFIVIILSEFYVQDGNVRLSLIIFIMEYAGLQNFVSWEFRFSGWSLNQQANDGSEARWGKMCVQIGILHQVVAPSGEKTKMCVQVTTWQINCKTAIGPRFASPFGCTFLAPCIPSNYY